MLDKKYVFILSVVVLSVSTHTVAEEKPAVSSWKGEAELGYISTSGNTDTETLNTKAKVINDRNKWKNTFTAEATKSSDSGTTTAQRNFFSAKSDYNFGKKSYVFGLFEYEDDKFSGYDYQSSLIVGYGRKLMQTETLTWDAELGAGSKQSKLTSGATSDNGIVYVATEVDWKLSGSASINEKFTVESGETTTYKSVTGLKAKINSKLASKVTYTMKHVSEVPAGIKNDDTELAVTLVYNF